MLFLVFAAAAARRISLAFDTVAGTTVCPPAEDRQIKFKRRKLLGNHH
jgi:hypothetical protein